MSIGLAVLCCYSKQVFGPRTAKYQPIWIKFCTHLLLYGIHLWADLDRDRGMGEAKPKRLCFSVILVTHPKSSIETTDRRDFGGKPSKSGGEDGCYREKFRNFVARTEPDPKIAFFRIFRVPFDYPAHSLQETVLPQTMIPIESRDYEGVPFASLESL